MFYGEVPKWDSIYVRVCADSWHKTCSCEMGSKSAVIVFDDANFDLAVSACIASSFKLSGQRCVSAGRILVQRGIYDEFAESFCWLCISSISRKAI